MNAVTTWNPFKEMDELQQRLATAFVGADRARTNGGTWAPLVDVHEEEGSYRIVAELPGLTREDIEVKVEGEWLHITGERKALVTAEGSTCLRNERTFGRFARSFRLPDDVNPGAVTAEFRDGLLQIGLTKREEALPKVIDVKIV
ncbi:MAG: Hsp20/alpha crystallin family protein [Verrucomicrobiae bacterium]|jgi:HSP20 family protein|nr:Hsp20/alpha crystallin family protein [Verrucomicrobiae bacterium]